jgi:cell division protein FtsB
MNKVAASRKPNSLTLERLHAELKRLRRRVEDLEDLRELNAAIARNDGKPGVPWAQVKKELGI